MKIHIVIEVNVDSEESIKAVETILENGMTINDSFEVPDDLWENDPNYPREDWGQEAANNDTSLGYWQWVSHQKGVDGEDIEK